MLGNEYLEKYISGIFLASFLLISPVQTIYFPNMFCGEQTHLLFSNPQLFSNGISYLDYNMLRTYFGGEIFMNAGNFSTLFKQYFIPANIRLIGLSVGWEEHANTTFSNIPYYQWVDEFLSIADRYGVKVFFYFGSWKPSAKVPSWWGDVVKAKPELGTSLKNGTIILQGNPLIIDSPLVLEQLKEDLKQLYQYYGKHVSWVGIAFGRPGQLYTYAPLNGTLADWGFEEYTLYNFLNSIYYLRDVNATGYHWDGSKDKLWEMFMEDQPLIKLTSSNLQRWGWSPPLDVYGERNGSCIAIKFKSPEELEGFQVLFYGYKEGNPGNLTLELYEDENDFPKNLGEPLEIVYWPENSITTSPCWQSPIIFTSRLFRNNYYWIVIHSQGDSSNKYLIYRGEYRVDNETHIRRTTNGYEGYWEGYGSAFIIIKDLSGRNVFVHPFRRAYNRVIGEKQMVNQRFIAPSNITVNAIWLYLVDRAMANDPRPLPITLIRTSDGTVMAEGELGIPYTQGTYWWSIIPLNERINLTSGEQYELRIGPAPEECVLWQLVAERVDPAEYGFQGQQDYLLFALADMDVNLSLMSYPLSTPVELLRDPITSTDWMAVGFTPTKTGKLHNFSIKIVKFGLPSDLKISLYDDDNTPSSWYGLGKPRREIESLVIPVQEIPSDGWLQVGGWSAQVNAGSRYWIVMSQTSTSQGVYRVYSKGPNYILPFVFSTNSGAEWKWGFTYTNTPNEPLVKISTTAEIIANEPWEIKKFNFGDKKWIAQSFILDSKTAIRGVNIWLSQEFDSYEEVTLEIRTDEYDAPSSMILAKAVFKPGEGLYSANSFAVVDFGFPIELRAGKYWIVIKSMQASTFIVLWSDPECGFGGARCKTKVTADGGLTWVQPERREGDLIFSLVKSPLDFRLDIKEIVEDIETYHIHDIRTEPLRGWNVYLNVQTSRIQKELIQWFESYTGKRWFSIDPNPPRIIQEVQGESKLFSVQDINNFISKDIIDHRAIVTAFLEFQKIAILPSVTLRKNNFNYVENYYEEILPLIPTSITLLNIDNILELDYFLKSNLSRFLNVTRRMICTGQYFGEEKQSLNVLFVGDQQSVMLARYLTSLLNITFLNLSNDYNLSRIDSLSPFHVIIWASDKNFSKLVTESAQIRIKDFVKNGGGFVVVTPWPKWIDEIVGFSYSDEKITLGSINYVYFNHTILKPYSDIPRDMKYGWENKVYPTGVDSTYIIRDINDQPLLSTRLYGFGRSVLCATPTFVFSGGANGYATIILNTIFYAAGKEGALPIVWHQDFAQGVISKDSVQYSMRGKPGGPLLLWPANNGPVAKFEIHLNASFFQLDPEGWIALDVFNWAPVARGRGNDVGISIHVTNMSQLPIYITNDTQEFRVLYSNAIVETEKVYPNQAIYSIKSYPAETIWLIIRSSKLLQAVIVDDHPLPKTFSSTSINAPTSIEGWFYDPENELLKVKLKSEGEHVIRVMLDTSTPLLSQLDEHKYLLWIFLTIFIMVFEFLAVRRTRLSRMHNHVSKAYNKTLLEA